MFSVPLDGLGLTAIEASCSNQSVPLASWSMAQNQKQKGVRKEKDRKVLRLCQTWMLEGASVSHQITPKTQVRRGRKSCLGDSLPTFTIPVTMYWKVRLLNPSLAMTNIVYWKYPAGPECVWVPLRITLSLLYREPYLLCSLFRTFRKKEKRTNKGDNIQTQHEKRLSWVQSLIHPFDTPCMWPFTFCLPL